MNLLKVSNYMIFLGLAILAINFIVVSSDLPDYPDESDFRKYYRHSKEDIIDHYYSEVSYTYKCLYGRMNYESTCPGSGKLPYFTYFAILLIVIGFVMKKSIIPPKKDSEE